MSNSGLGFDPDKLAQQLADAYSALAGREMPPGIVEACMQGLAIALVLSSTTELPAAAVHGVSPAADCHEGVQAAANTASERCDSELDLDETYEPSVHAMKKQALDRSVWVLGYVSHKAGERQRMQASDIARMLTDEYGLPSSPNTVHMALCRHVEKAGAEALVYKSRLEGNWVWQITKAGEDHIRAQASPDREPNTGS